MSLLNSYPINSSNLEEFYHQFKILKGYLEKYEYRSGFIQRLKDGYGIIHTPRRVLTYGDRKTELLLSLFSDNKSYSMDRITTLLGENLTNKLLSVGLFVLNTNTNNKESLSSTFRILPVNQFLLLIPFRQFNDPPVYIGADSLTFARHIEFFRQPKKILDLATGSGFQLFNLPWHSGTTKMTGLDVNPNAILTGTINSSINETKNWINFEERNIEYDIHTLEEKFDLIIGNPPIIPTPESTTIKTRLGGMIHADGGHDGFNVIRKIIPQIPPILSPQGSLQLILCSLGNSNNLFISDELSELLSQNNLFGQLDIVKKIPVELDAYYRGQKDLKEYNRWIKFYEEENASYWYRLILRADKIIPTGSNRSLNITKLIRNDFSQIPNGERITLETIKSKISFYLSDTLLQNENFSNIEKNKKKIEKIIQKEHIWKTNSIRDFGIHLFNQLPDLFPTEGSAIRFWGQVTNEYWWKPKYLERVLW